MKFLENRLIISFVVKCAPETCGNCRFFKARIPHPYKGDCEENPLKTAEGPYWWDWCPKWKKKTK